MQSKTLEMLVLELEVLVTVEGEGRGDYTPPKPYPIRKQQSFRTTPFTSPSISLSLKGQATELSMRV